jgi:hypothetical protein
LRFEIARRPAEIRLGSNGGHFEGTLGCGAQHWCWCQRNRGSYKTLFGAVVTAGHPRVMELGMR